MVGVYKITNRYTGDFYIGCSKHIEKRWTEHFCKGYGANHKQSFQQQIDKYGRAGFLFEVLEECAEADLRKKEAQYINLLNPAYNTIFLGYKPKDTTKEKIRERLSGRKQPTELVQKRRVAILERHKKIPQTNKGHFKPVCVCGVVHESVKAAAAALGVSPSTVTHAIKRGGRVRNKAVWFVV